MSVIFSIEKEKGLLEPSFIAVFGQNFFFVFFEAVFLNRFSRPFHDLNQEADVMNGIQALPEFLIAHLKMVQIGFRVMGAGIAIAVWVQRREVFFVLGPLDIDPSLARHQSPVPGEAGGQDAVEHVDAILDPFEDVIDGPNPHEVARLLRGQKADRVLHHPEADVFGFPDGSPADGIPGEIHFGELLGGVVTQVLEFPALDDAKQGLVGASVGFQPPRGPAEGPLGGFGDVFLARRIGDALIKGHDNVRAQGLFDADRLFGGEEFPPPVDFVLERDAFLGDFPPRGKGEDLESARVGEDGAVVIHELMQAPGLFHDFLAGAKVEMVGIGQDNARPAGGDLLRRQRLHGRVGPNRHEHGNLNVPVPSVENPVARPRFGVDVLNL